MIHHKQQELIQWNPVQYFEIGQSVVDRGRWYWYSGETVEAEKYHRQENKYRRQIQRWGQHDWLEEKNTENWKSKSGQNYSNVFFFSCQSKCQNEKKLSFVWLRKANLFPPLLAFVLENQFSISTFSTLVKATASKKVETKAQWALALTLIAKLWEKYCIIGISIFLV